MVGNLIIEMTINTSFEGIKHYPFTEEVDGNGSTIYVTRNDNSPFHSFRTTDIPLTEEWQVNPAKAEDFIEQLGNVTISPCPCFAMGMDGTTFTVKITHGFNSGEYTWWGDLSEQWDSLRIVSAFFENGRPCDSKSN